MTSPDHNAPENAPELSIVVPAFNEEENVAPLVEEIKAKVVDAGIVVELVVVDDGSKDSTYARLTELAKKHAFLRVLRRERSMGQSAAMFAGIQFAHGRYVATLDADLQNDPSDLPPMLAILRQGNADMVQGLRAKRQDTIVRKASSWVGRTTRKLILGDDIRDTGCTTRVLRSEIAKQFPLQFKGMHRFMPVYARMVGARIVEQPVNHRPRVAGVAKYGVWNRGLSGLIDCFAMRWMLKRYRNPVAVPLVVEQKA
ncbi:MAG: glycosyltransferase family 2 protein [Planctomycetota bacterium]|nr:glycosyltransferase family 2 protein [Planctomycetota bacterium]